MRITLTFDSVHRSDMPVVLDCIAETCDTTAVHDTFPNEETREATVVRCGANHYTITKGPVSQAQATHILDGLDVYYTALAEALAPEGT